MERINKCPLGTIRTGKQGIVCSQCGHVENQSIEWYRIRRDVNGNSRHVCHFSWLMSIDEIKKLSGNRPRMYSEALARARKIGGKPYRTKAFPEGVVFQTTDPKATENDIEKLIKEESNQEGKPCKH